MVLQRWLPADAMAVALPCGRANGDSQCGGEYRGEVCAQSCCSRAVKNACRNLPPFHVALDTRVTGGANPGFVPWVGRVFRKRSERIK